MFAPPARPAVVVANFKGLALLAGAANPKQSDYAAHLQAFCAKSKLHCVDAADITSLAVDLMNRIDASPVLVELRAQAEQHPEQMYREVMEHMAAANPSAISGLGTSLDQIEVVDSSATGSSTQGGRKAKIKFIKASHGWQLSAQ